MLDPWIIEEIRRREREEREQEPLRIDIDPPQLDPQPREESPESDRGVVIIDL